MSGTIQILDICGDPYIDKSRCDICVVCGKRKADVFWKDSELGYCECRYCYGLFHFWLKQFKTMRRK